MPFRQLGQYEDVETSLYYNRFRYYSPDTGTYISQDPIGLLGRLSFYAYVHDVNGWIDPLGLNSTTLNKNLGGIARDKMQAHHVIPEEVWNNHRDFFNDIGIGGDIDKATNGILLPDNAGSITKNGPQVVHRGSHPKYSADVDIRVTAIKNDFYNNVIDDKTARKKIRKLQMEYKNKLWNGDVPHKMVDNKKKLH